MLARKIRDALELFGRTDVDVRFVEAFMRSAHPAPEQISSSLDFRAEVRGAVVCVDVCPIEEAEGLARSLGL